MAFLPQQQLCVFTKEKTPANYTTKWSDLHPDCQKFLLQIEERMLEYRDKIQRLDLCDRLHHSFTTTDTFQLDVNHILKELGGISFVMEREKPLLHELMTVLKGLMRNTEVAVYSFMMVCPRFIHRIVGSVSNAAAKMQPPGTTIAPNTVSQVTSTSLVPVCDFYSGMPRKPSPFLYETVVRFKNYIGECLQMIEVLERLLLSHSDGVSYGSESSLLQSLPKVMSNVHDFIVHVAAKVESIHQYIESMKTAYLADQRRRGDVRDPFLEADRRELAKQESAAKRVHPTLHLKTSIPQPSTQVVGLCSSMPMPATSNTPRLPSTSSNSGVSLSNMPYSAPSLSIFSTPSVLVPAFPPFESFAATPQSSTGNSVPSTSPPFASGPTTGPEANYGHASKAPRSKFRRFVS